MQFSSINEIYSRLEEILENENNDPPQRLGSYIVGCTVVPYNIEKYYRQYPALEDISELGSSLETQNPQSSNELLEQIQQKMVELKASLSN